ncbi:hypothetical protein ACFQY5_31725 [Paeniroseomonas aquatica]|uniref:hypothetical protein n=1 Tax=Paeniroseomonas aquatica TaxID=373043 RepID=UPI003623E879
MVGRHPGRVAVVLVVDPERDRRIVPDAGGLGLQHVQQSLLLAIGIPVEEGGTGVDGVVVAAVAGEDLDVDIRQARFEALLQLGGTAIGHEKQGIALATDQQIHFCRHGAPDAARGNGCRRRQGMAPGKSVRCTPIAHDTVRGCISYSDASEKINLPVVLWAQVADG